MIRNGRRIDGTRQPDGHLEYSSSHASGVPLQNVLLEIDSSVRELAEGSSLLQLSGLLGVLKSKSSSVQVVPTSEGKIKMTSTSSMFWIAAVHRRG